jgi:hypothetical protein
MKTLPRAHLSVAGLLLVGQVSCASVTYTPRPSHRIARVDAYMPRFVREGQRYDVGQLGGGLEALVAGNGEAVAYARKYRRDRIVGFSLFAVGLATWAAGSYLLLEDSQSGLSHGILWSSLVPYLTSVGFLVAARHDLANAVNAYNDGIDTAVAPAFPAPFDGR